MEKIYACIDLKSFYASVECVTRNLDPLKTNLVVADVSRTEKTICLAVSPALKAYGIPGRLRLFELNQKVKEINLERQKKAYLRCFVKESVFSEELQDPNVALSYIAAPPQMALYMKYSAKIYEIYLKYIAKEDIHVYSIDEVFMDITPYLSTYKMGATELIERIISDIYTMTHITATGGIGTNLYLAKVAMDIEAKHVEANAHGVRIAYLDQTLYKKHLWNHEPLTDFWRIGRGYQKRLSELGLTNMGDIARCSIEHEDVLFRVFGINAELLIDHAWGNEPCEMKDIKGYVPQNNSLGTGQVLSCPYTFTKARLIVKEMVDSLALSLVEKGLITDIMVLTVGYDIDNIKDKSFEGEVVYDYYGRAIPKSSHGSIRLKKPTNSFQIIAREVLKGFDQMVDKSLMIRRLNLSCGDLIPENQSIFLGYEKISLFEDIEDKIQKEQEESVSLEKEKNRQKAILGIKKKYGKNAIVRAMDLEEDATTIKRNSEIGGHKA